MSIVRERQSNYLASVFAPMFGLIVNDIHIRWDDTAETIAVCMMNLPEWSMSISSDDEFYEFVQGNCSLIIPFMENAS